MKKLCRFIKISWYRKRTLIVFIKEKNPSCIALTILSTGENCRSAACINHGNFTVPIYTGIRAASSPIGAFDRETNNPRGIPEELLVSHDCTCRVFQRDERNRGFCKFENFTLQRAAPVRDVPRRIPSQTPDKQLFLVDGSSCNIRPESLSRRREGRA